MEPVITGLVVVAEEQFKLALLEQVMAESAEVVVVEMPVALLTLVELGVEVPLTPEQMEEGILFLAQVNHLVVLVEQIQVVAVEDQEQIILLVEAAALVL